MWSGDSAIEVALERRSHPAARLMEALARDGVRQLEDVVGLTRPTADDVAQREDGSLLDRQGRHRGCHGAAGPMPAPDVVREAAPVARVRAPVTREAVGPAAKAAGIDGGLRRAGALAVRSCGERSGVPHDEP